MHVSRLSHLADDVTIHNLLCNALSGRTRAFEVIPPLRVSPPTTPTSLAFVAPPFAASGAEMAQDIWKWAQESDTQSCLGGVARRALR